jgi:MFS superfamily sulfate permease-like transporter
MTPSLAHSLHLYIMQRLAGAISWAVMVPVAMAYAQMAGLPAQAGLYASLASL